VIQAEYGEKHLTSPADFELLFFDKRLKRTEESKLEVNSN
jgi:hypothetical protein